MTEGIITADAAKWEHAFVRLQSAKAECNKIEMPKDQSIQGAVWACYHEAEDALLDLPAPNIEAVIAKLWILWAYDIPLGTSGGHQKRTLIGDLRRMQILSDSE